MGSTDALGLPGRRLPRLVRALPRLQDYRGNRPVDLTKPGNLSTAQFTEPSPEREGRG